MKQHGPILCMEPMGKLLHRQILTTNKWLQKKNFPDTVEQNSLFLLLLVLLLLLLLPYEIYNNNNNKKITYVVLLDLRHTCT